MKSAKCTNCNANITVDETKDAGICPYCQTAYITEKAIYNITNNTNNITNNYNNEKTNFFQYLRLALIIIIAIAMVVVGFLIYHFGPDGDGGINITALPYIIAEIILLLVFVVFALTKNKR